MAKLRWELLATDNTNRNDIVTWRAEVPGGWLVSVWAARDGADAAGANVPGGSNWGGSVTFVPDAAGEWKPEIVDGSVVGQTSSAGYEGTSWPTGG